MKNIQHIQNGLSNEQIEFINTNGNKSGFFDLPKIERCNHPSHNPPQHLYIPQGKGYKHVCPGCCKESILIPQQISF